MSSVLEVTNLSVRQEKVQGKNIVDNVSFAVRAGECLGILGESGSGKSLTVKAILGLLDRSFAVSGQAIFQGQELLCLSRENMRRLRGRQITMVLQNPMTCFDPLCRVGEQMTETFIAHQSLNRAAAAAMAIDVLQRMRIREPEEAMEKYPHQLSGGMLQRIMIGIAMALEPELLIADEPTTAIDAITQFEILNEFIRIKESGRTSMIFITHDLGAVSRLADKIIVMNGGRIVDSGDFQSILNHASDPYTRMLVENKRAVMQQYRAIVDSGREADEKVATA